MSVLGLDRFPDLTGSVAVAFSSAVESRVVALLKLVLIIEARS
jgi:hypothetical protein